MMKADYISRELRFKRPAGTSRGVLERKACWYIRLRDEHGCEGLGEVAWVPGLSPGDAEETEIRLDHFCKLVSRGEMDPDQALPDQPGLRFALETALRNLERNEKGILFPGAFTRGEMGIPINGLIWMGEKDFLLEQIRQKLEQGFRILKLKVGALDFDTEMEVLRRIRSEFLGRDLEIRLDANGAWSPEEAPERLDLLSVYDIHSIEQPIRAGQTEAMAAICRDAPIPLALDEELLGVPAGKRKALLEGIRPAYLILKPGLLGGFSAAEEWIRLAEDLGTGWWITSALESNVGLNAIAQWTAQLDPELPQGLGTGSLYENNVSSPLEMEGPMLWFRPGQGWTLPDFP